MLCKSTIPVILLIIVNWIQAINSIWLWFPRYTVLQVTMAMVIPFSHPVYKLNMNVGMQCNFGLPWNSTEFAKPPYWAQRDLHGEIGNVSNDTRFKRDLSAGEFYSTLESLIELRGFHSTCIMKSVCEMAQHSLHHEEDNILTMILHYVFTPSLHDSFEDHEREHQRRYKRAESLGKRGLCARMFKDCPRSLLEEISYLDMEP